VLIFGRELDPRQSPRERAPRDRLSRASRLSGVHLPLSKPLWH
jgi:hypothetical protein